VGRELRSLFKGQDCVLIGSAPDALIPARAEFGRCVCVNGSPFIPSELGIPIDLTVFAGHSISLSNTPGTKAFFKIRNLRGVFTKYLLYVDNAVSGKQADQIFKEFDFRYEHFRAISPDDRKAIVEGLVGKLPLLPEGKPMVTNGAFALALLLWLGARSVTLAGFSLHAGHSSLPKEPLPDATVMASDSRQRIDIDRWFFQQIAARYPMVRTTSRELAEETGFKFSPVEAHSEEE
jgi:hypothetical protein